jgi:hypothetical protein
MALTTTILVILLVVAAVFRFIGLIAYWSFERPFVSLANIIDVGILIFAAIVLMGK